MRTLKIGGDHTQAGTGRIVTYQVEYGMEDGAYTGSWGGEVLLLGGKRFQLVGGVLTNVTRDTIGQAVTLALNAEIDSLDLVALNKANGY
ncbi:MULTISPECIES: hypothetical protein [unclassified Variovorax]|uniref:hypothetical protein n=1 Tax=unclassified Variovorax TaxID=663243 RepID=UPI003F482C81